MTMRDSTLLVMRGESPETIALQSVSSNLRLARAFHLKQRSRTVSGCPQLWIHVPSEATETDTSVYDDLQ